MKVSKWFFLSLLFFALNAQSEVEVTDSHDGSQNDRLEIGLSLIQQKNYQQAEDHFQKLNQQYPEQLTYLNNLAVAQMAQGKTEQALKSLKTAMAADKLFAVTQKNISQIYAYMASQAYTKALDKKETALLPELDLIADLKKSQQEQQAPTEIKAETKQEKHPGTDTTSELKAFLETKMSLWASAWMSGDEKAYISTYSEKFQPENKLSYNDWLAQRRYRLRNAKQVEVNYTDINVYFNAEKNIALVEFIQKYRAGNYQDQVRKQLYWSLENENWLILREQVTEKL